MIDESQNRSLHDIDPAPGIVEAFERDMEMLEKMREFEDSILEHSNNELERMLVRALHQGRDFVDVRVDGDGNVEYMGWDEGHEPHYDFLDAPADRFDLRDVTYQDIQRAHEEHR